MPTPWRRRYRRQARAPRHCEIAAQLHAIYHCAVDQPFQRPFSNRDATGTVRQRRRQRRLGNVKFGVRAAQIGAVVAKDAEVFRRAGRARSGEGKDGARRRGRSTRLRADVVCHSTCASIVVAVKVPGRAAKALDAVLHS